MVIVAGFGNPLLDITVKIQDTRILKKYNLEDDGQTEVSEDVLKSILSDLNQSQLSYSAGGCAQNTLRVLQWLLPTPKCTYMYGCVGSDGRGEKLREILENDGVQTRYTIHESKPTGTSIALINGLNRSLVANIGAAECITTKDLILLEKSDNMLSQIDVIYLEGFFLTNRLEVANYVLDFAKKNNKLFVFNICGTYMCRDYPEETKYFADQCDLLFGNLNEYTALSEVMNLNTEDVKKFAVELATRRKNGFLPFGKMAVVTNGSKSVFCAHSNGKLEEVEALRVDKEQVKDTTGAGDSFVSGFLAGLFEKQDPKTCLKWGCWVAREIIQQVGCTVPDYPPSEMRNYC